MVVPMAHAHRLCTSTTNISNVQCKQHTDRHTHTHTYTNTCQCAHVCTHATMCACTLQDKRVHIQDLIPPWNLCPCACSCVWECVHNCVHAWGVIIMCVCVCVCVNIPHVHVSVCEYTTCAYVYVCVYVHPCAHMPQSVCVCVCMCVYVYVCVGVHVWIDKHATYFMPFKSLLWNWLLIVASVVFHRGPSTDFSSIKPKGPVKFSPWKQN